MGVGAVDVETVRQGQLDRRQDLGLRPLEAQALGEDDAGREGERGVVGVRRQPRVGPVLGQQPHRFVVGEAGGRGVGRRAAHVEQVVDRGTRAGLRAGIRQSRLRLGPRVGVGSGLEQQAHQVQALGRVKGGAFGDRGRHLRPALGGAGGHQVVEGGVPPSVAGDRIGAARKQQGCQRIVPVGDRHSQQALPVRRARVDVRTRREEQPRRVPGVLPDGEHQRREPAAGCGVDRGASLEQHVEDRDVALGRGPHQRSLAAPRVRGVDVGAARQERPDRRYVSRPRTREQRRLARGRQSWVGPRVEERGHEGRAGAGAGQPKRCRTVAVDRVGIRPGVQQQPNQPDIFQVDGPVERRRPVDGRRVDVDRPGQQARHHCVVAGPRRVRQPSVVRAGRGRARDGRGRETENGQEDGGERRPE